ncbi:hypothetical protein P872_10015 [Rhodonellum psychrophilum GCM71 = DSM 17998]|uniref:Uncharacterized protein n=1 Tax=Rhodonellum psychrophilum GCM71 = DSM 17998 TaxID=1123057 RepID=U5BTP5_9BACT|nr:hypothetical protein P872_10015 [Rhodonellum psychrophilum GCM71 = DSM 17998]
MGIGNSLNQKYAICSQMVLKLKENQTIGRVIPEINGVKSKIVNNKLIIIKLKH